MRAQIVYAYRLSSISELNDWFTYKRRALVRHRNKNAARDRQ